MGNTEVWSKIDGYPYYEVSNASRVRSTERLVKHPKGGLKIVRETILKQQNHHKRYLMVSLYNKGVQKTALVHILVAKAFISNPENKTQVNHINGLQYDNRLENLEWNTPLENMRHAFRTGLINSNGENHSKSKLTETQVLEIRASDLRQCELAKKYNVHKSLIGNIIKRKTWKHI